MISGFGLRKSQTMPRANPAQLALALVPNQRQNITNSFLTI
jgi:hypothetical protein